MVKKISFTLIVIQLIAYISMIINNDIAFANFFEFIGFNIFAIIGIILLIKDYFQKPNHEIRKKIISKDNKELNTRFAIFLGIMTIIIVSITIYVYCYTFGLI